MSLKVRVAVAIGCAILAVALMAGYAASIRGEASEQRRGALERYGGETATVLVATKDIVRGEVFSERNVEAVEWLVDLLPEGALVDPASLMGKSSSSAIARNTPLAMVDVSAQDTPLEVPSGLVAVSVPCSNESAVGGSLSAGSVVDIYVVSGDAARLLCQGVEVIATNADGTAARLSWATVALDPSETEAVIAASSIQRLYFALPSDEELKRRAQVVAPTDSVPAIPEAGVSDGISDAEGQPAPGVGEPVQGEDLPADLVE